MSFPVVRNGSGAVEGEDDRELLKCGVVDELVDRALQRQLPVIRRFARGAESALSSTSSGDQHP